MYAYYYNYEFAIRYEFENSLYATTEATWLMI